MTESIAESLLRLQVEDMEMSLLRAQQHFRNVMAHARCAICAEYIDDQRWHLGELHGEQEVVHTECYDAEEAAWSEDYESKAEQEDEGTGQTIIEWDDEVYDTSPGDYGSGSGQPEREAEAFTGADFFDGKAAETITALERIGTDAGEHGDDSHQRDAAGSRAPVHVAGFRGFDPVRLPPRVIPTGDEPITKRVPFTVKAQLRELVRKKPIDYSPKKVHTGLIMRGLKAAGEI